MTQPTNLDTRYGRQSSRDRAIIWALAVGIFLAFAAWFVWSTSTDRSAGIEWVSTEATTDGSVATLTWQITAPVDTAVSCGLRVVGPDMATNGWKVVSLQGSDQTTTTYTDTIRSTGTATGVEVYACWRTDS